MLGYIFAVLSAFANAAASVLQRAAGRGESRGAALSVSLVGRLLRKPVWFAGFAAVIIAFCLQAIALDHGELGTVQPILALELPITILLASFVLRPNDDPRRLGFAEWCAVFGMTVGLAGLIFFLDPSGGTAEGIGRVRWTLALVVGVAFIAALAQIGARMKNGTLRAGVWGVATGVGFGVTAALMKGMTDRFDQGISGVLSAWETYAMAAMGLISMLLLLNAVSAGRLVAAQPGFTLADPITAILWGVMVFGEHVRTGWSLAAAIASALLVVGSVIGLSQSPVLHAVKRPIDPKHAP